MDGAIGYLNCFKILWIIYRDNNECCKFNLQSWNSSVEELVCLVVEKSIPDIIGIWLFV